MKYILVICVMIVALTGCTSEQDARRALEAEGFTVIEITGYRFFGCGDDDAFKTGFVATNQGGKRVEGVVCSGWFKSATIRY